jgi:AraC-like DNA-binding protein
MRPTFDQPAVRRSEHTGADPVEAAAVYQEAYSGENFSIEPDAGGFSYRYASIGDERVTLRSSTLSGALTGEVPHLRQYVVSWFRSGGGSVIARSRARRPVRSEPFLLPTEQPFALAFDAHLQSSIHIGQAYLEDVATEFHGGTRQPVAFDLDADPDRGLLAEWRASVTEATGATAGSATGALVRANAQLRLARTLLAVFPWRALDVPDVFRQASAAKARVALEFMQHHAHEPITAADAARAAGVHTRTLQQATSRHLGISPSAYLRNVRLDRVHDELRQADPCSTTVAAVARTWGFGHLGRFSSSYGARFGLKPSATLRS